MNLNRRVPNGLPGGVRGRKFYYFLLLDYYFNDKGGLHKIGCKLKCLHKLADFKKIKNRFPLLKGQALFCMNVKACFRKNY